VQQRSGCALDELVDPILGLLRGVQDVKIAVGHARNSGTQRRAACNRSDALRDFPFRPYVGAIPPFGFALLVISRLAPSVICAPSVIRAPSSRSGA
jgi:hypothetical protein